MKRSTFSEEQIVYAIRQTEAGTPSGAYAVIQAVQEAVCSS